MQHSGNVSEHLLLTLCAGSAVHLIKGILLQIDVIEELALEIDDKVFDTGSLFTDDLHHLVDFGTALQDAARVLNRSVSFVAHNVPLEFGMPLKKYVREKRMQKAAEMLAQGKLGRECAFELGYKDEFYFSRDFKKYFCSAPKYKRKKQQ